MSTPRTRSEAASDPPPRWAIRCPRNDLNHTSVVVRTEWFYCEGCAERDGQNPRLYFVRDEQHDRLIAHPEFVERWGSYVYYDGRR